MQRSIKGLCVAGALFVGASGVAAQKSDHLEDALQPGRRAIATELRTGASGTTFGLWKVVAPDRSRGLFVTATASGGHDDLGTSGSHTIWSFSATVGPRFRHYLAHEGPVAGFGEGGFGLGASYDRSSFDTASSPFDQTGGGTTTAHHWSGLGRLDMGIGAEWFPLSRISVSWRTGIQMSAQVGRSHDTTTITSWSASANTFASSVMAQLYF